jgi:hypothetical protein
MMRTPLRFWWIALGGPVFSKVAVLAVDGEDDLTHGRV